MKTDGRLPRSASRLVLLQACALFGATSLWAQQAPAPAATAEQLARYDANKNGRLDPDEQATMQADEAKPVSPAAPVSTQAEAAVQLSPFTVDATRDRGYFAENTLAGSRLNTNIADLAASISVVTKQQLQDTAAVDINDVFLYETNTEGVGNFTQTHGQAGMGVDRTTIKDVAAGYGWGNDPNAVYTAATANRVRGIASPDPAQNFYPAISRIPWDSYNTASVDINRGPNSVLFGIGSPAGIVNQNMATALINRNSGEVELRTDHLGSFRGALNLNRTLIDDKLAVFVAGLRNKQEFERKPSEETTDRYYAALTFKPFKKTTLRAAFEDYEQLSRRPNYLTPRDYVTPWLQDGRPVYNPLTRMVTYLDTGVTKGPYITAATAAGTGGRVARTGFNAAIHTPIAGTHATNAGALNTNGIAINAADNMLVGGAGYGVNHPLYVRSLSWNDYGVPVLAVRDSQGFYYARQPSRGTVATAGAVSPQGGPPAVIDRTNAEWDIFDRRTTNSDGFRMMQPFYTRPDGTLVAQITSYVTPSVTNKAIYDWEEVNINSMNFGESKAKTYNVELEQELFKDLYLQLGWFYQKMDAKSNFPIGQQTGATLFVDTNTHLTNGEPNPFFGQPYVSDLESDTFTNPEENDNVRATLAYTLDFSKNTGITRWLGRHRLMGLWTEQNRKRYSTRARFTAIPPSDERHAAPGTAPDFSYAATSSIVRAVSRRHFYMGSNGNPGVVTQAAGIWGNPGINGGYGPTAASIPTYNWNTDMWENASVTTSTETWSAGTGGSQRRVGSLSGAVQSYLWKDRIVGTLGWRRDKYRARTAVFDVPATTTNPPFSYWYQGGLIKAGDFWMNRWSPWQRIEEETLTKGIVVHALRWGEGRNQLSLHYNESDNFTAPASTAYDFFGNALSNPGGEGKDYGVGVSLWDNKLFARLTWFETSSLKERISNNLLQRTVRFDTAITRGWANAVVRYLAGEDLTNNFANETLRPLNAQQQARILELTGQSVNPAWPQFSVNDTQDLKAEGMELQVTYNPSSNWTIKVTGGSQETVYSNTNKAWESWVEGGRMAFWQALRVPQAWIDAAPADRRSLNNVAVVYGNTGTATTNMSLLNFWTGSFGFPGPGDTRVLDTNTNGWTTPSGYWNSAVVTEIALAKQLEGRTQVNQRKWRGNILTNYEFTQGRLKGFSVGGAVRWEDKAVAGYYGAFRAFDRDGNGTVDPWDNVMDVPDLNRPIYVPAETHLDVWASYRTRIFKDKIGLKVQLNVRDALESGSLLPVYYNFDGLAAAYRIVDPRQIILTTTFSF